MAHLTGSRKQQADDQAQYHQDIDDGVHQGHVHGAQPGCQAERPGTGVWPRLRKAQEQKQVEGRQTQGDRIQQDFVDGMAGSAGKNR